MRRAVTLLLMSVLAACDSSSAPKGGAFDGSYAATIGTTTPAGTVVGAATFTVTDGKVANALASFTGTVAADGAFTGTSIPCQGCRGVPITGTFSRTANFTLSGTSGGVSQTIIARSSALAPRYQIIWSTEGGGRRVDADPDEVTYAPGAEVWLTPVPNEGRAFLRWVGDCPGSQNPCRLIMDRSKLVIAIFGDAATMFDGGYAGTYQGDATGSIALTVSRGVMTLISPPGTGSVASNGAVTGSFAPNQSSSCQLTGTMQLTNAGAGGTGSWTCTTTIAGTSVTMGGTWSVSRQT